MYILILFLFPLRQTYIHNVWQSSIAITRRPSFCQWKVPLITGNVTRQYVFGIIYAYKVYMARDSRLCSKVLRGLLYTSGGVLYAV